MSTDSIVQKTPFGVCYVKLMPEQVQNYEMVIIEPDYYSRSEIQALKATGTTIIAYITMGEVDRTRWYYPLLEERGFVGVNKNWDSPYLNLFDKPTRRIMMDKVLPEIMIKGVDGIFLDTIDAVAPYSERKEMAPLMGEMILEMRERYPETIIIQNAGLFLLETTRPAIDAVLIEDIASGYDFENELYLVKSQEQYQQRTEMVNSISEQYDVPFFIVDFANSELALSEVSSRLDQLGFPYFISNIQLNKLPQNPSPYTNTLN
jgi:uncharacterized protein (TIGR01370 family)